VKFQQTLLTESKRNKLLLLDIDDTIVKAKNIYIYKKTKGKEIRLTPEEYARENIVDGNYNNYDFREFKNAEKISNSIKTGEPIINVLKYMDNMIQKGYVIGVLTARSMEDVIRDTLKGWLMYEKRGKLRNIGSKLKEVFAINDELKMYSGTTDFEKKANVIKSLSKKYTSIIFIDDDDKNVDAVKSLNLSNVSAKNVREITT